MNVTWQGVIPAITTPFGVDGNVDHAFFAEHCTVLVEAGCTGIVALGSLGESATLTAAEKVQLLQTAIRAVGDRVPVIAGIAALSTADAIQLAASAHDVGCSGLMVLPPYVYSTDWREMKGHVAAVLGATTLSAMLYNNPIAYKTDFLPSHVAELAQDHPNLAAVKESSADIRRVTALRNDLGDRLKILVGVDDVIVECIQAGADGWIAGMVDAFPHESVDLFNLAVAARTGEASPRLAELYRWFLPLLQMDTVPKFVQLIKLAQSMVGLGSARVRAPRLELTGQEYEVARATIQHALDHRPAGVQRNVVAHA
ncbi:MAG: dihydrodipicolinate synthase family protein [Herpetosiphon sp.]